MVNSVRVIPIKCTFGRAFSYAYYIDAPEPVLIDTGVMSSPSQVMEPALAKHGLRLEDVKWILLTHGHADHIGGTREIWELTERNAEVVIHQKEAVLLRERQAHVKSHEQLQGLYLDPSILTQQTGILMEVIGDEIEPTRELAGGESLKLGGNLSITVVPTPGHSVGSVTYLLDGLDWAFVADAVQGGGTLGTRFPSIEHPALYRQSLKHLLMDVRPQRMYLGHHYLGLNGDIIREQVEGEEVPAVLEASLEIEARMAKAARRHLIDGSQIKVNEGPYAPFTAIAEELGYTGDTRILPSPFFITIHGYQEELMALKMKGERK
ncbi:MBL fold metallo-hydrolase [Neobacillus niacini]|uniref:MBL fold metallo-hydrolase n=1 Tax=Neobacillus niacini TaxID=86668 RepID=UPI00300339AD